MKAIKINTNEDDVGINVCYKSGNEIKFTCNIEEAYLTENGGDVVLKIKDDTFVNGEIFLGTKLLKRVVELLKSEEER